jgi:hypothetical protein
MQKHLSPPFRTKYLEPEKGDTFIGFTLFSTFSMEPVPTKLPNSMATRQELSNIGGIDFSPMGLLDCGKGIVPVAPANFLHWSGKDCETKYNALPGNSDTIKTCGMVYCCLIILKSITPSLLVYANAKDCSTSLALPCRDLAAKLMKPIPSNRRDSKKLLPMDEGPRYPALVPRRSPLPEAQQFDTHVGSQGSTTSRGLCLNASEGGLLWSSQPENGMPADQRGLHFQCRDFRRFSALSSSTYSGKGVPYSGQCQLAQGAGFEGVFHGESKPSGAYFPAALFPRTQSNRTGVEDHSQAGNPQPLLRIGSRTQNGPDLSFCKMAAAQ